MSTFWKPNTEKSVQVASSSSSSTLPDKPILSKSVMGMRFMKRKQEADTQGKEDDLKRRKLLDTQWNNDNNNKIDDIDDKDNIKQIQFSYEESDILSALPGRRSFGNFNKYIEKSYAMAMDAKRYNIKAERQRGVDDEEMVERYQSLIGLPRGPNQGLNKIPNGNNSKNSKKVSSIRRESNR
jgi:hypothetical protein